MREHVLFQVMFSDKCPVAEVTFEFFCSSVDEHMWSYVGFLCEWLLTNCASIVLLAWDLRKKKFTKEKYVKHCYKDKTRKWTDTYRKMQNYGTRNMWKCYNIFFWCIKPDKSRKQLLVYTHTYFSLINIIFNVYYVIFSVIHSLLYLCESLGASWDCWGRWKPYCSTHTCGVSSPHAPWSAHWA